MDVCSASVFCKRGAELGQVVGVQSDTFHFHVHQHGQKGHFNVAEQPVEAFFGKFGQEHFRQTQRDIRVLACIVHDVFGRKVGHGFLVLAFLPNQIRDGDALVAQKRLRQRIHAVRLVGLEQVMRHHGVLEASLGQIHTVSRHDFAIKLEVLSHDGDFGIFQQGLEHACGCLPKNVRGPARSFRCLILR